MDGTEEGIDELEDGVMEITHVELKREKRIKRNDNNLKDLWDNVMHTKMHIAEIPEGEEKEKEAENIFEDIIGGERERWRRNRTGRSLSPSQIPQKNISTPSKLHKTTSVNAKSSAP